MAPKIDAACRFVQASGKRAVIGSLHQIEAMLSGQAGTQILMGDAEECAQNASPATAL